MLCPTDEGRRLLITSIPTSHIPGNNNHCHRRDSLKSHICPSIRSNERNQEKMRNTEDTILKVLEPREKVRKLMRCHEVLTPKSIVPSYKSLRQHGKQLCTKNDGELWKPENIFSWKTKPAQKPRRMNESGDLSL